MKKILFLMTLCLAFLAVTPLFADKISKEHESEYFYVNVPITRVFPYRKGYVVEYKRSLAGRARVYLPMEWFSGAATKGEYISLPTGPAWPYLTIFYKSGEFSHVRLYVRRDLRHETWGNIPLNVNLDEHFENVTDVKLEF
ncbi:hypothetical protein FACS189498_3170 [Spirochaetia bacterium]|nr:hypothetical protein FACS189498_3170 [Spirochaetia bacterium]